MKKEIWRDVIGYENLYQCSNLGRIKSLGNGKTWNEKERILKQTIDKRGYCRVMLCKEGKQKKYLVHRLVATTFLDNPQNLPQVNHKNEQKTDNRIENLEWCTQEYNNNYGTRLEKFSNAMKGKKRTKEVKDKMSIALKGRVFSQEHRNNICKALSIVKQKPIVQIHQSGLIVGVYDSARQVERELNINHSNIASCLKGKTKTAGGFKWIYLNELKKAS
jgi:hypothetical protein